jgi:hypothetical protein
MKEEIMVIPQVGVSSVSVWSRNLGLERKKEDGSKSFRGIW